jgi:carbon monoxide dehydrogenase subunit G
MRLEDEFAVAAPIQEVYATLLDVERVTGCVPGAELLGNEGDVHNVGIRVKVGPISMQYRGDVEIVERDEAAHTAKMRVKGREVRGQGTVEATAQLRLSEDGSSTRGAIEVDVALSGRAASMGQGAIQDVSSKLVGRFARNLTRMLEADGAAAAPAGAPASVGAPASPAPPAHQPLSSDPVAAAAQVEREVRDEDESAISGREIIGAVVAGRLRNPVVSAGLAGVMLGLVGFLLGRRAAG